MGIMRMLANKMTVFRYGEILRERADAVVAEYQDDGTLSGAEVLEQFGKLQLAVAAEMGEDVSTDGG